MAGLLDQFGNPIATTGRADHAALRNQAMARIKARWDAAQTTSDNENHWANADALSAAAAGAPEVRAKLRNRARYEVGNNCYAGGLLQTLANDLVGTGPRIQFRSENDRLNHWLDNQVAKWADAIGLAEMLRTARIAKAADGEVFFEFATNWRIDSRVKLWPILIEADRITTPDFNLYATGAVDGIVFDAVGMPLEYHRLRHHPGDLVGDLTYDTVPASRMLHLFRRDRPGQVRGIPELTPALPLFAQLRRYVLAVLASAETAADYAAVMYTDFPNMDPEDVPNLSIDDGMPIQSRMFQVLPNGWKIAQLKAEQPTTQFGEFRSAILSEIARCVLAPRNVATGDSSAYNYASGRLDRQLYAKARDVERSVFESRAIRPMVAAWLYEAALIEGYLPDEFFLVEDIPIEIYWDGDEHVDPTKEATAQKIRLVDTATTTRRREYAKQGLDVDEEDRAAAASYGVTVEEYRRAVFQKHFSVPGVTNGQDAQEATQDESDEEPATASASRLWT